MLTVEFPSGSSFHFDTPEALARAVQSIRAGTPIRGEVGEGRLA